MIRNVMLIAWLAVALTAVGAEAQGAKFWHIGLAGGMSVPISDAKDALKSGFHGEGFVSLNPSMLPIGVRATFSYEKFDLKKVAVGASGNGQLLGGLANVVYGIPLGIVKPYITAGLGAFDVKSVIDSAGSSTSGSKVHFAVNGGVGLEVKLGSISGFIEGRLNNIYTDQGFNSALASSNKIKTQVIPVTLGVIF